MVERFSFKKLQDPTTPRVTGGTRSCTEVVMEVVLVDFATLKFAPRFRC